MRAVVWLGTLLVALLLLQVAPAEAHVRGKWTLKVDLNKSTPTYDDFAFFIESYVHRELYLRRFDQPERRFYVAEFLRVEQQGDALQVHFRVIDNRLKKHFDDSMAFVRRGDGVWVYRDDRGVDLPVYTYENWYSYYERSWRLPYWYGGAAAVLAGFLLLSRRRRLRPGH
ncbi:hypothetical protein [Desulfuromonas thiophila]|uniref:hypothetical protein n=1 Tax=Desulfuromonas thiophila TaxID=57664 RepID=UPI0024A7C92C|nr:hypothetical protein [Desulfuromonas thiophila]